MIGFALGGVVMGRLSDRFGIIAPIVCGAVAIGVGYVAAGFAPNLMTFALVHALIGVGASATFGPLMADTSQWFLRRRGIAVAIVSSGNYVGGAFWPPVVHHFIAADGWRATHIGLGVVCVLAMLPFALLMRRRAPMQAARTRRGGSQTHLGCSQHADGAAVPRGSCLLRGMSCRRSIVAIAATSAGVARSPRCWH